MAPASCALCQNAKAILKRPKTGQQICKDCFFLVFETEVHHTITTADLFKPGDRVAIGASGGKGACHFHIAGGLFSYPITDSTVLAYVMKTLNERYNYGLELYLLSIDEGITGYRDDSLETVKRNQQQYDMPLKILSYEELYGWTMDAIVSEIGKKNNCTFCGVFRRQALDRGASALNVDHIVTGHNADDIAETVLMNIMRGDIARLGRCTLICTQGEDTIKRSKPFKYAYEKEIVMYAYFKKLDYFSTECIYSPDAYRGHARTFLKDLEAARPSAIIDIIHSGEAFEIREDVKATQKQQRVFLILLNWSVSDNCDPIETCKRCGYMSSNDLCKACVLLEGLERGMANSVITDRARKNLDAMGPVPDNLRTIPHFLNPGIPYR
ncbi:cytoplasmic tRNA 2-thiolation protein 1 [Scleroderma citrinum]